MGSIGTATLPRVKVANQVYESENYQLQKVSYNPIVRSSRGGARTGVRRNGYVIYDSTGKQVDRDAKGHIIEGYKYSTQKEAKAVIEALEIQRKKR